MLTKYQIAVEKAELFSVCVKKSREFLLVSLHSKCVGLLSNFGEVNGNTL